MKTNQIKEKIVSSLTNSIPDNFNTILSKCEKKKGKFIMKESTKTKTITRKPHIPKLSIALALLLLVFGLTYFGYNEVYKVNSIIELDVNPSIEIKVNKKEKIVKIIPRNDDAEKVLDDMDLEKVDIDVALNAIIGSMVTKGYIDDLANSILISVENKDKEKGEELRQKLVNKINNILGTDKIKGSILSQNIDKNNKDIKELAKKYNISEGKASLILDILSSNKLLKEKDLIGLSINELNILSEEQSNSLKTVKKEGIASTKSYIGEAKAKQIALNHANISNPKHIEVEFDADEGIIVYEVDFNTTTTEYEYEINATTGEIIKYERESDNRNNSLGYDNQTSDYISKNNAKQIALNHAGVSNPQNIKVELDREDNEYTVEFIYNNKEYEYEINAKTGNIINFEIEDNENHKNNNKSASKQSPKKNQKTNTSNSSYISSSRAKQIALNHAGVSNPQNIKVELDREDNEYTVEFIYNNKEYEYEINAKTGTIKNYNIEKVEDD